MWLTVLTVVIFAFSVALLLVLPQRDVTQPAGRWQFLWELLAPGTSPRWGALGGFVLLLWSYLVVEDYFLFELGTPCIFAAIAIPDLTSWYGAPAPHGTSDAFKIINPSWVWLYLAPAVLFTMNLVLVFRDKLFRKSLKGRKLETGN